MPISVQDLTPEQVEALKQQGVDVNQLPKDYVFKDADEQPQTNEPSVARSAVAPLKAHAGGIVGGGLGGLTGVGIGAALAPETGGASLAIPILSGLLGGTVGGVGGQKLQEATIPQDTQAELEREAQEAYVAHPVVARGSELLASAIAGGGRPSLKALQYALGRNVDNLAPDALQQTIRSARQNVLLANAINAGAQTGIGAAEQLYNTGTVQPGELLKQAGEGLATGALFSNPNWLGKTINPRWHSIDDHIAALKESADSEMLDDQSPKHDEILQQTAEIPQKVMQGWQYQLQQQARQGLANDSQINQFARVQSEIAKANIYLDPTKLPDSQMLKNFKQFYKKVSAKDDISDQANNMAWNNQLNSMSNEQKRQFMYRNALTNVDPSIADAVQQYMNTSDQYVNMWKQGLNARDKIRTAQLEAHQTAMEQQEQEREQGFTAAQNEQKLAIEQQKTETQRQRNLALVEQGRQETERAQAQQNLASQERIQKTNLEQGMQRGQIVGPELREGEGTATRLPTNVSNEPRSEAERIQDELEQSGAKFKPASQEEDIPTPKGLTEHLNSGNASSGTILQHFANEPGHPYQEIANEFLKTSDVQSLATPWHRTNERSHYRAGMGDVQFDPTTAHTAPEILEEVAHSLQVRKVPVEMNILKGREWKQWADNYIRQNPNSPVSDLADAYIQVAKHLGLHEALFNSPSPTSPDELRSAFVKQHGDIPAANVAYAMGDFAEFNAHVFRTKPFQELLNHLPSGKNDNQSMWQRIVNAIKSMFGLSPRAGSMLERVLRATGELHSMPQRSEYNFSAHAPESERNNDIKRFGELEAKMRQSQMGDKDFIDAWQERENIKNKYGGMPPDYTGETKVNAPREAEEEKKPGIIARTLHAIAGSAIDRVSKIPLPEGKTVAKAFTRTFNEQKELFGKGYSPIHEAMKGLNSAQRANVQKSLIASEEAGQRMTTNLRSKAEQTAFNAIRKTIDDIMDERIRNKEPVMVNGVPRMPIRKPFYYPHTENEEVGRTLREGTDVAKIAQLKKDWMDYQASRLLKDSSPEQKEAAWKDFLAAHQGTAKSNSLPSNQFFAAIRRPEGWGLPESMRRNDPEENMYHYVRRSSMDMSHYKNIESDPQAAAALGYTQDAWGNKLPTDVNNIHGNSDVKAVLDEIRGEVEPYNERAQRSIEGIASALILGPKTEIHKIFSVPAQLATFATDDPIGFLGAMTKAAMNLGKSALAAQQNGLMLHNPKQIKSFTDANTTMAQRFNLVANAWRTVYTVNGLTERLQLGLGQGISEYLVKNKAMMADNGDATAIHTMQQIDPDWVKGKEYTPQQFSQLGTRLLGFATGTRDARTMPTWMLHDNEISSFFKLMSWNVAQTNSFLKNVWEPATKGDYKPLLMTTLGATLGGLVIKELREKIGGKPSQIPTLADIEASSRGVEGNIPALAYNWMAAASYGGLGGIVSIAARYPFDIAFRNHLQGAVFPLDEYASEYASIAANVADALVHDPTASPVKVVGRAFTDILLRGTQMGQVGLNAMLNTGILNEHSSSETVRELSYQRQMSDEGNRLKHFQQTEGLPIPPVDSSEANPYLNLESKRFKHTEDVGEAMGNLQEILRDYIQKYGSSPDILMQKIKGLKINPVNVFPSIETSPIVFGKYLRYLQNEYGETEANSMLASYMKRKAINAAKSSMVP